MTPLFEHPPGEVGHIFRKEDSGEPCLCSCIPVVTTSQEERKTGGVEIDQTEKGKPVIFAKPHRRRKKRHYQLNEQRNQRRGEGHCCSLYLPREGPLRLPSPRYSALREEKKGLFPEENACDRRKKEERGRGIVSVQQRAKYPTWKERGQKGPLKEGKKGGGRLDKVRKKFFQ